MGEKKYLKWYNKIGYGSGDIAGNVVYAFLTSFMMVYLTDSVGLAAGVVGSLIAVSKLLDGFTDIFFGSMIDKTHRHLRPAILMTIGTTRRKKLMQNSRKIYLFRQDMRLLERM